MRATRGDLVIVQQTHNDFVIGQGLTTRETFEVGVVTSVTREGVVKRFRSSWLDSEQRADLRRNARFLIASAAIIDVRAALETAKAHVWDAEHPYPKPYDSLAEAQAALRPHLLRAG